MNTIGVHRRVVILAHHVHPLDARLLRQRQALLAAGFDARFVTPETELASAPGVVFADWRNTSHRAKVKDAVAASAQGAPSTTGTLTDNHVLEHLLLTPVAAAAAIHDAIARRRKPSPAGLVRAFRASLAYRRQRAAVTRTAAGLAPSAILVSDPESLPAAVRVKKRTGARLVYDAHEFHEEVSPGDRSRRAWVRRIEAGAAGHLDGFITVNAGIARLYTEAQPAFPPAVLVHNAQPRRAQPKYDGRLHRAAELPVSSKILLFQGGLAPLRGLERLVDAAPLLPPEWAIVIMGYGPLEPLLRSRADADRVRFVAPAPNDELPNWTCGASLGAILYEDIGLNQRHCTPNKLWEYPACGVPILGTDLPEMRALAGEAGFWMPTDATREAISGTVESISPEQLERALLACKALTDKMNWETEAARLVTMFA